MSMLVDWYRDSPPQAPAGRAATHPAVPACTWYERAKRVGEFVFALALLALTSPVILAAALVVRLTSRGPAFYSQTRLGRGGRPYRIWKLRTMYHNCEKLSGARWASARDPRITRAGRVLRKTHLDELPQLWNVLWGDMSLVGPRPERPEFVPELERAVPGYSERLRVRPGMTGLAQIQLPADTDLDSVRRKLTCDLYYVRRQGLLLDLQILLGTAGYLLGVPFGWMRRYLGIPGLADLSSSGAPERFGCLEPSPAAVPA
jgi:lipopolysaccharide/colanic/teichoic acid biosynthesis glycosyltransferase